MTTRTETHAFQAEARELLDLMIHSLYSHKEIFLRELISNASDALDKRRVMGLTDPDLRGEDEPFIRLESDSAARTLTIVDNGIGMTRDEVVENIGTIARSGTRAFLDELKAAKAAGGEGVSPELIGQFGVGFYSSFMVASQVVLETCKAGTKEGVRWTSEAAGDYTLEDVGEREPGTRITLHLRDLDAEDGDQRQDFTDEWTLRAIVRKYSDFVEYPILMDVERTEPAQEDEAAKTTVETVTLNSRKPLWTRPRDEIEESEYQEFYKHVSHDWGEPLRTIHFRAEGVHEYTALLFVPKQRPFQLTDPQAKSRLSLYVKRVFVMEECEELAPPWLRFVCGLVDSADLPLNVSRETLQHNRQVHQIRSRVIRKVLDSLGELLAEDREAYLGFWRSMGPILKEGLYLDDEHRQEIAGICLFASSADEAPTTLAEYVERMPDGQPAIYTLLGQDRQTAARSPHLEALTAKGYEALFLVDPVDEWVVQRLTEFDGKPLRPVERGDDELEEAAEKEAREEQEKELRPVLDSVQECLDDVVKTVRLSGRLRESPAVLVADPGAPTPQMERMLRAAGQEVPETKRILELNPEHEAVKRLVALHRAGGMSDDFARFSELLHGQALLAEGSTPNDPARFARLLADVLVAGAPSGGGGSASEAKAAASERSEATGGSEDGGDASAEGPAEA